MGGGQGEVEEEGSEEEEGRGGSMHNYHLHKFHWIPGERRGREERGGERGQREVKWT